MGIKDLRHFFKYHFGTSYPYRRYFNKHKVIFIHIPKTAGTSVLHTLAGGGKIHRDHIPWKIYNSVNRWKYERYFKFAFVRNPFDRAVSTYEYLAAGGNRMDDMAYKERFEKESVDFEKFVLEFLDCEALMEKALFKPQYLYIFDGKDRLQIDFLGRFESIGDDYKKLAEKIGLPATLPKKNVSGRSRSYKEYYRDPAVAEKIVSLYRKDFELLGYDKVL